MYNVYWSCELIRIFKKKKKKSSIAVESAHTYNKGEQDYKIKLPFVFWVLRFPPAAAAGASVVRVYR